MNATLLATSRTKPISWLTMSIVMPSRASVRMVSRTSETSSGSSAAVTSSSSRISGFSASARAMATRCCCPPGELIRIRVELVAEADALEQAPRFRLDLRARPLVDLDRRDRDVVEHGHVLEQIVLLEHDRHALAHAPHVGGIGVVDRLSVEADAAAGRLQKPDQHAQDRALARARRADQADDLARADAERDAVEHACCRRSRLSGQRCRARASLASRRAPSRASGYEMRKYSTSSVPNTSAAEKPLLLSTLPA